MDTKSIVYGTISIIIAVLVTVTILIPVVADSTAETDTFTNEGYFRMSHFDDTTNHTFSWDHTDPNNVTVDGTAINVSGAKDMGITAIADTNWIVRVNTSASGNVLALSLILSTGGTNSASTSNEKDMTITFNAGSMSALIGDDTKSGTYTDLWLPSLDGDYIMKLSDKDAYINADSKLVAYGLSRVKNHNGGTTSSPGFGISMVGSYEDGLTTTVWRDGSTGSVKDETINVTEDSSHNDLYELSTITATFVLTQTENDETFQTETPLTYSYFIVPYQVTAERTIHPDAMTSTIINIIPILVITGIILGCVGLIAYRRL